MAEHINEPVNVVCISKANPKQLLLWKLKWRGRTYTITQMGLHHPIRRGRTLHHIFSVTDGNTFFRISLNTESLLFTLEDIATAQEFA